MSNLIKQSEFRSKSKNKASENIEFTNFCTYCFTILAKSNNFYGDLKPTRARTFTDILTGVGKLYIKTQVAQGKFLSN